MASFSDYPLREELLQGVEALGFTHPLPIQEAVFPIAFEGSDIIGCSQTGTGKTAAFLLPLMENLLDLPKGRKFLPRALILTPTRELAQQVQQHCQELGRFSRLTSAVVHGGTDATAEERLLQDAPELLVATPGRLLDHLDRGSLGFDDLEYFVVDEADRLLDSGFLPDLRRIVDKLPDNRQTMLFSATMPKEMEQLAREILNHPVRLQVSPVSANANVEESFWPVPEHQKLDLLKQVLAEAKPLEKVMVFVRTRAKARSLAGEMKGMTGLEVAQLHGELEQSERTATMEKFRTGEVQLLIATDVASRGLDIPEVTHVVNYDVPNSPDDYIHRVGRTGRVDRKGVAITLISPKELILSMSIEEATRRRIPTKRLTGFPYDVETPGLDDFPLRPSSKGNARSFRDRELSDPKDKKKKKPFTKTGQLIPEFREEFDGRPSRNKKKRIERKFMKKKLPHQRKRKG